MLSLVIVGRRVEGPFTRSPVYWLDENESRNLHSVIEVMFGLRLTASLVIVILSLCFENEATVFPSLSISMSLMKI
jgi:hypothetical protein